MSELTFSVAKAISEYIGSVRMRRA